MDLGTGSDKWGLGIDFAVCSEVRSGEGLKLTEDLVRVSGFRVLGFRDLMIWG